MGYTDEIKDYIDSDNLIGSDPHPTPQSNGNPLTLCGVSACIDSSSESEINKILSEGVASLESIIYLGMWDKKARSNDEVTHDDLIGLVCFSFLMNKRFHIDLYHFGEKNRWILSNTGKTYFTSIAKPWHKAFYKICAGINPSVFERICLSAMIKLNTMFSKSSGLQLTWLIVKCLEKLNKFVDECKYFRSKIKVKEVLGTYHGLKHPFYKYCTE